MAYAYFADCMQEEMSLRKPQGNTTSSSEFHFGPRWQLPSFVVYGHGWNKWQALGIMITGDSYQVPLCTEAFRSICVSGSCACGLGRVNCLVNLILGAFLRFRWWFRWGLGCCAFRTNPGISQSTYRSSVWWKIFNSVAPYIPLVIVYIPGDVLIQARDSWVYGVG